MHRRTFLVSGAALTALGTRAAALSTSAGDVRVTEIASGFDAPWALGFLPDGSILITEKDGQLIRLVDGERHTVGGVGRVATRGQGGLLDVLIPVDFSASRLVFFTYSKPQGGGTGTAVARARLSADAQSLEDWQTIFEIKAGTSGGRHFGSRLAEGSDGTLYLTVGDRGDRPSAQDLSRENGSVLRITKDGKIPASNPFTKTQGAQPAIWSWGHRNPQGMAFDPQGQLWVVEHGARGGDEVNQVRKGANYGWPVISYGRHYSGAKIGEGTAKSGLEQPAYYWDPSIAPSGMMINSGRMWSQWRNSIFVGSLKFDYIARLAGSPLTEVEQIRIPGASRIRDIREGPDGAIWVLAAGNGALYQLSS
ncbi:MAG: PQQ-dependent sugar dehydrogenase [Pseudomonadota bacterium]